MSFVSLWLLTIQQAAQRVLFSHMCLCVLGQHVEHSRFNQFALTALQKLGIINGYTVGPVVGSNKHAVAIQESADVWMGSIMTATGSSSSLRGLTDTCRFSEQ